MSASRQDAPGESAPSAAPTSSPRILVTAPTNQDLLDHVMMEKRRQHRPPVHRRASAASTSASAGGTAAIVSRTSSVVAMTPSLMIRTPLSSQQQQQGLPSPPSGQVSGETSVHSSLMSADFSAVQVRSTVSFKKRYFAPSFVFSGFSVPRISRTAAPK